MLVVILATLFTPAYGCSIGCIVSEVGLPAQGQTDVPLDAAFIFPGSIVYGSIIETGAVASTELQEDVVEGFTVLTSDQPLLPNTEYTVKGGNSLLSTFQTGEDTAAILEPTTPVVVDSVYSAKGKQRLTASCRGMGNHRLTEVEWTGNAPMYELAVKHKGKEQTLVSLDRVASLGWALPCLHNIDLEEGDALSVQIRGWYWDGTTSDWSEETQLSTEETGRGCSQIWMSGSTSGLLIAGVVLGLRRRSDGEHP